MTETVDCWYWNPNLGIEDDLEFVFETLPNGIELRKPVFTIDALDKIINGIKQARKYYLLKSDIPKVLEIIEQVNDLWMNIRYKGRRLAREVLPAVTGFSIEMVE